MGEEYSEVLLSTLRSMRPEILAAFGNVEHDQKRDMSVVTEMDRKIERKLIDVLSEKYPNFGFVGEEHGAIGSKEKYWLIDPIDGTENYVRGIPAIGSIIGLVENGIIQFAMIYEPIEDKAVWAERGKGIKGTHNPSGAIDRKKQRKILNIDCLKSQKLHMLVNELLYERKAWSVKLHGVAHRSLLIIEGKYDGLVGFKGGGGDWDYAPTLMLMEEAGYVVTRYDAQDVSCRSFSVLTPDFDSDFGQKLKDYFDEELGGVDGD